MFCSGPYTPDSGRQSAESPDIKKTGGGSVTPEPGSAASQAAQLQAAQLSYYSGAGGGGGAGGGLGVSPPSLPLQS